MNIEQQVTKLELSRVLKELGVPQESVWYWMKQNDWPSPQLWTTTHQSEFQTFTMEYRVSAFTVAELGMMLPKWFCTSKEFVDIATGCNPGEAGNIPIFQTTNEANARAYALIWLIKEGHITI